VDESYTVELHAQSRMRTWQQVAFLRLGLHWDDVGQEGSWLVGLLLDADVGTREVKVQASGRRSRPPSGLWTASLTLLFLLPNLFFGRRLPILVRAGTGRLPSTSRGLRIIA
jgi:hypothetical protein